MAESDLFALLDIMLRTFANVPKIKAGGHPEEIFLDITEDEKEDIECSICYQILKDVRQCENKHKFCYSCIFVWSTSGSPANHSRCPVCRVEGIYIRNNEIDELINNKLVKCSLKTCRWKGPLNLLQAHHHTTYSDGTSASKTSELPALRNSATSTSQTRARTNASAASDGSELASRSHVSLTSRSSSQSNTSQQRQPLRNSSLNNTNVTNRQGNASTNIANSSSTNRSENGSQRSSGIHGNTTGRSRNRSRHRQGASPSRRVNTTTTGLPAGRLTSRARIRNGVGTTESSSSSQNPAASAQASTVRDENTDPTQQTTSDVVLVPRPPPTPRPTGQGTARRLPTLPGLVSATNTPRRIEPPSDGGSSLDTNNNVSQTQSSELFADTPRRFPPETYITRGQRSFTTIRERLNESRQRLDTLMGAFSTEIDRGRHDLVEFQTERENRRQEQVAEVRDLGRRLTQVASELRGLLSQRRQIRSQIDNLVTDVAGDDSS